MEWRYNSSMAGEKAKDTPGGVDEKIVGTFVPPPLGRAGLRVGGPQGPAPALPRRRHLPPHSETEINEKWTSRVFRYNAFMTVY